MHNIWHIVLRRQRLWIPAFAGMTVECPVPLFESNGQTADYSPASRVNPALSTT